MKGWLDKYQVGGQANKWQVSPKGVAANKAARQPIKDIDAAASNALEKVTSYPQRKATELITGKNQYPAEAMGITNPLGVILANSILDPANLLGVGEVKAASKLLKGAKGAKKVTNVADNIMQHITQDELMDVFPTLTSSSNNMTDVQRATQRAELRRRMQGWDQEMNNTSTAVGDRSPMMGLTNLPGSNITPSPAGGLMGLTPEEVTRTWENFVPMDFSSNWNLPKKTLLSKLKDKAGKAVNVVDKKLGEMVSPPRKLPKGVSIGKLSNEINEELIKGVGVKKEQYPLRIALSGDLDRLTAGTQIINPATNKIENVGQISLSRLTKPYGSKKFSEILFPDKNPTSTTPRDVWSNTLGFAKETDFPFGNLPKDEQLMFHHLGISGEYNKAINEVLKRNNLGNVLSGGTGHTDLGLERWKKLANKGLAEDFGDKFYKLKKDGGWLEKYNDGGPIQPNYNDYSVSAGPGFEGDGYSNVGRNYSPAWGGQFQMGGSLPGATGFMYARTGSIPSNGKYAKKTKASAQNGTEMKFYQEGLDFKPKTISRDGNNVAYADNTRVGAVPRYTRPSNYQGNQPDTLGENIFEIVDPSGVSSWDDIYRSYNKTGMSHQTGIEAFGAIPMLGKLKKAGQFLDIIGKAIPKTGRQARNLKASVNTIKAVGKYGPTAGRATDAIQAYTQRNEYEEGGVIQDDMGQWAYPGEITEIGSNQITMQGVDYPVLGISDTGDMQMMYPNQEYQYDGESVTEYPMMAEGGKVATDTSMPRMVKTNKKSSLINKQEELPLYYGPNVFENCVGAGCSKLATTETANLYGVSYDALSPQDAWYKKAAVLKNKGKEIWDPSKSDYSGVKVGDFVSMDRFGHDHDRDVSPIKGFTLADNEKVEHVGTVIGRNEQGIPLIKHGSEHGKVYVQPITDLVLPDANDVNIPLYYKPKSIYRSAAVENLDLKNKKYYTKPGKIDPIVWQNPTEAPTENEKKYLDAINKNAPMQQLVYGLTPEETKRINEVSWGIFHNETKAGATSKPVGGKMIAASLLHAFGRDNAASLGDVQIKYDDLMFNKDGSISKTGRLMQEMGVNRDGLYSPLEHRKDYNDEVNSVAAALATSLDKIKNNPTKYKYNPDKNTVYGNIPVDEALATIYRLGAVGFKESALRKHLSYGKAAATHVNRDIEPSKKPIVNVGGQPLFAKLPKKEQGGQLTKLDQLTNFTNYNTKQPGGWLDKYQ
tara:strand:- start:23640 stop:27287 length:3648 start_codon:yes stop_codon:yes gene_type:complete